MPGSNSALQQYPASGIERPRGMPEKKCLFGSDTNLFIARSLRFRTEPAVLMKPAGMMQSILEAERVINGTGQLNHFLIERECLIGEAEMPQAPALNNTGASLPASSPTWRAQKAVRSRSSNSSIARAQHSLCAGEIAPIKPGEALKKESFHQDARILKAFSEGKGFICQLAADAEISTDNVVGKVPPHHGKKLRSLLHALAQSARPMEDRPDFRCCVSPRGDIGRAERAKQFQLAVIPGGRRLEGFEQFETLRKVADGFGVSKSIARSHPRP